MLDRLEQQALSWLVGAARHHGTTAGVGVDAARLDLDLVTIYLVLRLVFRVVPNARRARGDRARAKRLRAERQQPTLQHAIGPGQVRILVPQRRHCCRGSHVAKDAVECLRVCRSSPSPRAPSPCPPPPGLLLLAAAAAAAAAARPCLAKPPSRRSSHPASALFGHVALDMPRLRQRRARQPQVTASTRASHQFSGLELPSDDGSATASSATASTA
jgi:hypothetical protein